MAMLGDAHPGHPAMQAMQAMLYVYVDDVDAADQRAMRAGAPSQQAPTDQFHGCRGGTV
jgi:uncharacterized glyoxalase superfamily protein PhnB